VTTKLGEDPHFEVGERPVVELDEGQLITVQKLTHADALSARVVQSLRSRSR